MDIKEEQKTQAIKIMEKLIKYRPIITKFKRSNEILFSEGFAGASYDAADEPKLTEAIEKVKAKGYLPFHATHNIIEGMEVWTILVVSPDKEDWEYDLEDADDGYVFCYCENVDEPDFSEFGTCYFRPSMAGDIIRV